MHKLNNDSGAVSIIVSILIAILLSLIAVSFAQLMTRERTEATDNELSQQAYYAAESGINEARKAFYDGKFTADSKNTCDETSGPLSADDLGNDSAGQSLLASYTCITYDQSPKSLVFGNVSTERSKVFLLNSVNDNPIPSNRALNDLTIYWADAEGSQVDVAGGSPGNLNYNGNWVGIGAVQLDITPLESAGFTSADINTETRTFYLYPNDSGSTNVSWNSGSAPGAIQGGRCTPGNKPLNCEVRITGLPLNNSSRIGSYIVRMKSIYNPTKVIITGRLLGGGSPDASFSGVQVLIDATGKSNDVTRSLQDRIPINPSFDYPEYALDATQSIIN